MNINRTFDSMIYKQISFVCLHICVRLQLSFLNVKWDLTFEILIFITHSPHQWLSGNAQNWKIGGARFKSLSQLSTQPFGVFQGFLRNSHKNGLGSIRKTPTEVTSPLDRGPISWQLAFNLQPTNQSLLTIAVMKCDSLNKGKKDEASYKG